MNFVDRTSEFDVADIEKNKAVSAIAYFYILFFLPLVACSDSKFGRFHANQGLLLLFVAIISGIVGVIPFIGRIASCILGLVAFAGFLYGLINTINGKAMELPFIGNIRIIK